MANYFMHSLVLLILFIQIQKGYSIVCYVCSSPIGGYCDVFQYDNPAQQMECPAEYTHCYATVSSGTKNYHTTIERGCTVSNYCNPELNVRLAGYCFECSLNLCNNAVLEIGYNYAVKAASFLGMVAIGGLFALILL